MAVVPGVLLDHVEVYPAHAHHDLTALVEEGPVQLPACRDRPGELDLLSIGGEVPFGVRALDVVELPVGVRLAGVEEGDVLSI